MLPHRLTEFLKSLPGRRVLVVLLVAYWALLFAGTHLPIKPSDEVSQFDKVFHFGAYFGLGWLLMGWVILTGRNWSPLAVVAGLAVFGAVDEVLQIPVGRQCDVRDWIADCAGSVAGVVSVWLALRAVRHEKKPSTDST